MRRLALFCALIVFGFLTGCGDPPVEYGDAKKEEDQPQIFDRWDCAGDPGVCAFRLSTSWSSVNPAALIPPCAGQIVAVDKGYTILVFCEAEE